MARIKIGQTCRHCMTGKASRPKQLCWTCYCKPGVREMYPSTSKFAKRGIRDRYGNRPISKRPTISRPGSEEKIAVLCKRAERGEALFHPNDLTLRTIDDTVRVG